MMITVVAVKGFHEPSFIASGHLITSLTWSIHGDHAHMSVWSRGQKCGTLIVAANDAPFIANLLLPPNDRLIPR